MNREIIPFTTKEAWLKERAKDITSTEIAALFGCHPWLTDFELFHRKKGTMDVEFEESEAMEIGSEFEAPIAKYISKKEGYKIKPKKHYIRLSGLGIGSSFDYEITHPFKAIFEIKNVGEMAFAKSWKVQGEDIQAPVYMEFQFQHELLVSGAEQLIVGAMIGGNRRKVLKRLPDPDVHKAILEKCASFKLALKNNEEPKPDFNRDAEFIAKLFNKAGGEPIQADAEITVSAMLYAGFKKQEKEAKDSAERQKAQILMKVGTASKVVGENFSISLSETKGSTYTVTRKPGRSFRIFYQGEEDNDE